MKITVVTVLALVLLLVINNVISAEISLWMADARPQQVTEVFNGGGINKLELALIHFINFSESY